nr:MAG TPA: hypothetical protein [Caudoviricetes sp.]
MCIINLCRAIFEFTTFGECTCLRQMRSPR